MTPASFARAQVPKLLGTTFVALAFSASGLATGQAPALASPRTGKVVASHSAKLRHRRNPELASARHVPALDMPASPAMVGACDGPASTPRACDMASLREIDSARASEGLGPLYLPAAYESLATPAQLVAVTDAERTSRGLPALRSPDVALDLLAARGAASAADPGGPAGTTWASNMAEGMLTVLQTDYEWMYDDGPGGTNLGCSAPGQAQCWAHRDNILSPWPGRIGAAVQPLADGRLILTELMVATG